MKNIVLYKVFLAALLLMVSSEIFSQKPAIDLLPFTHQRIHPEAILDTGFTSDSQKVLVPIDPPVITGTSHKVEDENMRIEKERKWLDFDSVFRRQDYKKEQPAIKSGNYFLIIKFFNPVKLFLNITALKK